MEELKQREGFGEIIEGLIESLGLDELLSYVAPEKLLAGLDPEQRLAGLDPEQIVDHLDREQLRQLHAALDKKLSQS